MTDEEISAALAEHGAINRAWTALTGRPAKACTGAFKKRARRVMANQSPMRPDCPDGFHVVEATTTRDGDGALERQSIRARADTDGVMRVPEPWEMKRISTMRGASGVTVQWQIAEPGKTDRLRAFLDSLSALLDPIRGAIDPTEPEGAERQDELAAYIIGDAHIGMHAWREESGEDWDLKIAERVMVRAIDRLTARMPPADEAIIVNLGDLLHFNDQTNRTPGHGHQLDVDGRWQKVMRCVLRILRYYVDACLRKHARVTVYMVRGNHDPELSLGVALALDALFEREPRVTVDTSPAWYKYHRFGSSLIGLAHGDGCKAEKLPELMAAEMPREWGETENRVWWTGHIHHLTTKEHPGCTIESFRTLAAKDSWHARNAYRSGREMKAILIHREYGETDRATATLKMLGEESP